MAEQRLRAGTIVGAYRVDEPLREKASGLQLYAAQTRLGRPVTLALLREAAGADRERLQARIRALMGAEHPRLASIYDVGTLRDDVFVVRRRVAGTDLDSLVEEQGPLSIEQAIELLDQVTDTVSELHRLGLSYGDISMRNVVVDMQGAAGPQTSLVDLGLTGRGGAVLGSAAPELRRGEAPGERSDVYALGTLLLGETLGTAAAADPAQALRAHAGELPGMLDAVVARATQQDPAARYASPQALMDAVHRAVDPAAGIAIRSAPEPAGAPPPRSPPPPPEGDGGDDDPPRAAYARLDAPEAVVAGEQHRIAVGLSPEPDPNVAGDERLVRPPASSGPYTLSIHVVAPDFELAEGESWRNELRVTREEPYPALELHLAAKRPAGAWKAALIQATYSVDGQTMGLAVRSVVVVRSQAGLDAAPPAEAGSTSTVPTDSGWPEPDLTVNVVATAPSDPDSLHWTFESPHPVVLPDAQPCPLGSRPEDFTKQLLTAIPGQRGAVAHSYVRGAGETVTDVVPPAFWPLLRAVAAHAGGPPTVLINSAEAYVPWELAIVDPPLDPAAPPFLAAQAVVGRWVLAPRRPKPVPPQPRDPSRRMTVVSGVYSAPGLPRLEAAEAEADDLGRDHGATCVDARLDEVVAALQAKPGADVLHFAMHARGKPGALANGLVMVDKGVLEPLAIEGLGLDASPFVFLNACEAGAGAMVLGAYAGLAAAFLRAGACGVVAPLWEVDDGVARTIAAAFYADAFGPDGVHVAEYLRTERIGYDEQASTTRIAYLFYGHPAMRLHAVGAGGGAGG